MPTPFESAQLNLQLFDLRREPVLREAREWFLRDFNPDSLTELIAVAGGPRNASFRMVLGYWDMAASLVSFGAVDAAMFLAAHTEIVATFAKVQPFLAELRAAGRVPEFCRHIEALVMGMPDAEAVLEQRRSQFRAMVAARAASTTATTAAAAD